jgi:hypothetical protein
VPDRRGPDAWTRAHRAGRAPYTGRRFGVRWRLPPHRLIELELA